MHPYDILPLETGALIFTPCPGTKNTSIEEALKTLKAANATTLITVMPDEEMAANEVSDLQSLCQQLAMDWIHLPVADDSAPDNELSNLLKNHQTSILNKLQNKERIAIHCKGGSGRTGLMAALIMRMMGVPLADVKTKVKQLRPKALSIPAHLHFLDTFSLD